MKGDVVYKNGQNLQLNVFLFIASSLTTPSSAIFSAFFTPVTGRASLSDNPFQLDLQTSTPPLHQTVKMAKCNKCGNDTNKPRGFETQTINCDRCDRSSGYRRCNTCTRGPRDIVLKCCGHCSPAGKIKCQPCDGKGTRKIKVPCTARHSA
jgi:hypothetical protein